LSDIRYLLAAMLLILFASYTLVVVQASERLQGELQGRTSALVTLASVQRTLQVSHPDSGALPEAFADLGVTLSRLDQEAPTLRPSIVAVRTAQARLQDRLSDPAARTEARTALFVAIDDLVIVTRRMNKGAAGELETQWTSVQRVVVASCFLATLMLVLLVLVRARGREAESMRARLEQALLEAEEARAAEARASAAKSDFLATVSHEIRTPMTAILGTAELLSGTPLRSDQQEHLEVVRSGGESLLRLINDVLDLSRFEAGHVDLVPEPFEVEALIDGVVLLFAAAAEEAGITLAAVSASEVPAQVVGDEARLRQVLVNLVGNAVKFTERGHVYIRVAWSGSDLECSVEDTGPGLHPEDVARVFQAFEQGDSSRARSHGGTGLGLAIARRLVEAMSGALSVQSEFGEGATFRFELPLTERRPAPTVEAGPFLLVGPPEKTGPAYEQLVAWGLSGEVAESVRPDTPLSGVRVLHLAPFGGDEKDLQEYRPNLLRGPVRPRALRRTLAGAPAMSGSIRRRDPSTRPLDQLRGRLLVVDDNETNRKVIGGLLERLGYEVDSADGGVAAIELASKRPYDLVFMDCDMPCMDGLETTQVLREGGGPSASSPVVGLSGHAGEEARSRGLEAGMSDYLSKPVRLRTLQTTLDRWLANGPKS
jgi:signal transduction histidine kinase/CheY-like chemotaxis protein